MKRSEFLRARDNYWGDFIRDGRDPGATSIQLARRDIEAAEFAGFRWDPEEPEMPKEICAREESNGYIHLAPKLGLSFGTKEEKLRVYCAAADAYNRLQSGELVDKMEAQSVDHFVAHSLSALIAKIGAAVGASGTADQITGRVIAKLAAFREELDRMKVWQGVAEELREKLDDRTNRADRAVAILEGA